MTKKIYGSLLACFGIFACVLMAGGVALATAAEKVLLNAATVTNEVVAIATSRNDATGTAYTNHVLGEGRAYRSRAGVNFNQLSNTHVGMMSVPAGAPLYNLRNRGVENVTQITANFPAPISRTSFNSLQRQGSRGWSVSANNPGWYTPYLTRVISLQQRIEISGDLQQALLTPGLVTSLSFDFAFGLGALATGSSYGGTITLMDLNYQEIPVGQAGITRTNTGSGRRAWNYRSTSGGNGTNDSSNSAIPHSNPGSIMGEGTIASGNRGRLQGTNTSRNSFGITHGMESLGGTNHARDNIWNFQTHSMTVPTSSFVEIGENGELWLRLFALASAHHASSWAQVGIALEGVQINITYNDPDPNPPTILNAYYGSTLGDVALPVGWRWLDPRTTLVGDVGQNQFNAQFFLNTSYNPVIINVAYPLPQDYTVPGPFHAREGAVLGSINLPSGWAWANPDALVGNIGIHNHNAIYLRSSDFSPITRQVSIVVQGDYNLELFGRRNLALGRVVTACSIAGATEFHPQRLTDGYLGSNTAAVANSSRWAPANRSVVGAIIHLSHLAYINQVEIFDWRNATTGRNAFRIRDFDIYVSAVNIGELANLTNDAAQHAARFATLTNQENNMNWIHVHTGHSPSNQYRIVANLERAYVARHVKIIFRGSHDQDAPSPREIEIFGLNVSSYNADTPTVQSYNSNSITIASPATLPSGQAIEFGISTTNNPANIFHVQQGLTFENLNPETAFYIFARGGQIGNFHVGQWSQSARAETLTCSHDWEVIERLDPTCTTAGFEHRGCRDCPARETIPLPALGPLFGDWQIVGNEWVRTCTRGCNAEERVSIPTLTQGITAVFGQTLDNVGLTNGWVWESPNSLVGNVGTQSHYITYSRDGFPTVRVSVDVNVTQATLTPDTTLRGVLELTYGSSISEIQNRLPLGWVWVNPNALVGQVGINSHQARYVPSDSNFATVYMYFDVESLYVATFVRYELNAPNNIQACHSDNTFDKTGITAVAIWTDGARDLDNLTFHYTWAHGQVEVTVRHNGNVVGTFTIQVNAYFVGFELTYPDNIQASINGTFSRAGISAVAVWSDGSRVAITNNDLTFNYTRELGDVRVTVKHDTQIVGEFTVTFNEEPSQWLNYRIEYPSNLVFGFSDAFDAGALNVRAFSVYSNDEIELTGLVFDYTWQVGIVIITVLYNDQVVGTFNITVTYDCIKCQDAGCCECDCTCVIDLPQLNNVTLGNVQDRTIGGVQAGGGNTPTVTINDGSFVGSYEVRVRVQGGNWVTWINADGVMQNISFSIGNWEAQVFIVQSETHQIGAAGHPVTFRVNAAESQDSDNTLLIVAGSVGGLILLAGLAIFFFFMMNKKRNENDKF